MFAFWRAAQDEKTVSAAGVEVLWTAKPCSVVEGRAGLLQEDVLRACAPAVSAGQQNWRDEPIATDTRLLLLREGMEEPFLRDVSKDRLL